MENLLNKLKKINTMPMHMPGHKRNEADFPYLKNFVGIDITEIEGFDNLHNPTGILRKSMERAAKLRGADKAFYLLNGSTCGILASVMACARCGDKIIMARNCHKSVYNAIEITGAKPVFIYPEYIGEIAGSIKTKQIEKAVSENPDAKLVVITSPSYEGVISDIKGICDVAHKYGIPVLADAAHGAHLGYGNFQKSATQLGADISVESLHKTLPSLTQTAICYASGHLVDINKIAEKLSVVETSSPSYILLSSIDGCIDMLEKKGKELFKRWTDGLELFYKKTSNLQNLKILNNIKNRFFDLDISKIVVFTGGITGGEFSKILRKNGIEPEMSSKNYVVLMTGLGDTENSITKLADVLVMLDKQIPKSTKNDRFAGFIPEKSLDILEARDKNTEKININTAENRICGEYIFAYPPGVPILVPGEQITKSEISAVCDYKENGVELFGGIENNKIIVIK